MRRMWRRLLGGARPGLTLIELLVAIVFLGLMGSLLLPRLATVQDHQETAAALVEDSAPCLSAADASGPNRYPGQYQEPYVGIGAVLDRERSDDGYVCIDQVFAGDPAEQAGVEPGDRIEAVDGRLVQDDDINGVTTLIRDGPIGSTVELTIGRAGYGRPLDVVVTRACIDPPAPFGRPQE